MEGCLDFIMSNRIKRVIIGLIVIVAAMYTYHDVIRKADDSYPKYIFLFIGDGMGSAQIQLASDYLGTIEHPDTIKPEKLSFLQFPTTGMVTNYDTTSYIPDSASSGSAIASGKKIPTGAINYFKDKTFETIAEKLHEKRHYRVGIVSSVNVNHTTPADFYAHQASRKNDYEIGIELMKSQFDFFAGGGFRGGCKADGTKESLERLAKKAGYSVYKIENVPIPKERGTRKQILLSKKQDSQGVLPYVIDDKEQLGALKRFVKQGISCLKTNNQNGFFLMVEGGKIDWACHQNDTATCIQEVFELDKAVEEAVQFYNKHKKETLILVTADHETGGLSLGYSATGYSLYLEHLNNQKISYDQFYNQYVTRYRKEKTDFQEVLSEVEELFGLTTNPNKQQELGIHSVLTQSELEVLREAYMETLQFGKRKQSQMTEKEYTMHGANDPFTSQILRILANKSGVSWSTYGHSGICVPVFAIGNGQELFDGYYDNTEICKKLEKLTGI